MPFTPLSPGDAVQSHRRAFFKSLLIASLVAPAGCHRREGRLLIGFAQIDSGGIWRTAETNSFKSAAEERLDRFELVVTDAQDQAIKQIGDIEDLLINFR